MTAPTPRSTGTVATIINDSAAHNVPAPGTIVSGDCLVMFIALSDSSTPNTPTGGGTWLLAKQSHTPPNNSNNIGVVYYRIAGGSEPANYSLTIGSGGGRNSRAYVVAYKDTHSTTPVTDTPTSVDVGSSSASFNCPNITTTVDGQTIVGFSGLGNTHGGSHTLALNDSATLSVNDTIGGSSGYSSISSYNTASGATHGTITGPKFTDTTAADQFWGITLALAPAPPPSCALSGTITTVTEAQIVSGGKTIILTLTNDTWVASGATFDAQRQNIINGLTSAGAELLGWNNVVKALQGVAGVVRTSATVVTITLDAQVTYSITADETITVTLPSTALVSATSYAASPTFIVVNGAVINYSLTCAAGTITLTGLPSTLLSATAYNTTCAAGAITLTGKAATLTYTPGGGGGGVTTGGGVSNDLKINKGLRI